MEACAVVPNSMISNAEEECTHQDAREPTPSIPSTPTLQRKNSQRRLRIPTEDHRLFLADLNEEVLPYIRECRQINNNNSSDEENELPGPAAKAFQERQRHREPVASSSKHRVAQAWNGYDSANFNGSCPGTSQFPCSSKFQEYNNNGNVSNSMDSAAVLPSEDPVVARRSKPAVKAYNSPKKSNLKNLNADNCTIA